MKKQIKKLMQKLFGNEKRRPPNFRADWKNENPETKNIPDPTPEERKKMKRFLDDEPEIDDWERMIVVLRYWKERARHYENKYHGFVRLQKSINGKDLSGVDGAETDSDDWAK